MDFPYLIIRGSSLQSLCAAADYGDIDPRDLICDAVRVVRCVNGLFEYLFVERGSSGVTYEWRPCVKIAGGRADPREKDVAAQNESG